MQLLHTCTYLFSIFTLICKWLGTSLPLVFVTHFYLLPIYSCYPHDLSSFIFNFHLLPTWNCYPLGIVTHFNLLPTFSCKALVPFQLLPTCTHLLSIFFFICLQVGTLLHLSSYILLLFICYSLRIDTHIELLPTWDCYPLLFVTHLNLLPTFSC